jgi:hypothetical protein
MPAFDPRNFLQFLLNRTVILAYKEEVESLMGGSTSSNSQFTPRAQTMLAVKTTLRFLLVLVTSAALVVPVCATLPCNCNHEGSCCSAATTSHSAHQQHARPCCAQHVKSTKTDKDALQSLPCDSCPCCHGASQPVAIAPQQTSPTLTTDQPVAVVVALPVSLSSVDRQFSYLARERGSPPGHPSLRLHAMKCVWLN